MKEKKSLVHTHTKKSKTRIIQTSPIAIYKKALNATDVIIAGEIVVVVGRDYLFLS
jgi:hypothetical protein